MGTMDVLSYPFRFDASGRAAVVAQRSDAAYAQQISQFIQTRPGELRLSPFYGLEDTAFRVVHPTEINAGLGLYHPEIQVTDVKVYFREEGTQTIDVAFINQPQRAVIAAMGELEGVVFNA